MRPVKSFSTELIESYCLLIASLPPESIFVNTSSGFLTFLHLESDKSNPRRVLPLTDSPAGPSALYTPSLRYFELNTYN